MKTRFAGLIVLLLLLMLSPGPWVALAGEPPPPPTPAPSQKAGAKITYAGGDGSSYEKAVVINGATEMTGVDAEYVYLKTHFPGSKPYGQSLHHEKGRMYDVLTIITADEKQAMVYFDITDFFGKLE